MNWTEALAAARAAQAEKPGKGWEPKAAVQAALGCSQTQCERTLRQLLKTGLAERKCFHVMTTSGLRSMAHFKLKQPAK